MSNTAQNAPIFDALGNPTRRTMLRLLQDQHMAVGQLAEHLPISRPAVSKHLRILEDANLVNSTSDGTRNIYRINPEGFAQAKQWLESFWDEALTRFQLVAENT